MLSVFVGIELYLGADNENVTKNYRTYTKQMTPYSRARGFINGPLRIPHLLQLSKVPVQG